MQFIPLGTKIRCSLLVTASSSASSFNSSALQRIGSGSRVVAAHSVMVAAAWRRRSGNGSTVAVLSAIAVAAWWRQR